MITKEKILQIFDNLKYRGLNAFNQIGYTMTEFIIFIVIAAWIVFSL